MGRESETTGTRPTKVVPARDGTSLLGSGETRSGPGGRHALSRGKGRAGRPAEAPPVAAAACGGAGVTRSPDTLRPAAGSARAELTCSCSWSRSAATRASCPLETEAAGGVSAAPPPGSSRPPGGAEGSLPPAPKAFLTSLAPSLAMGLSKSWTGFRRLETPGARRTRGAGARGPHWPHGEEGHAGLQAGMRTNRETGRATAREPPPPQARI